MFLHVVEETFREGKLEEVSSAETILASHSEKENINNHDAIFTRNF